MQQSVVIFVLVVDKLKTAHDFQQLRKNYERVCLDGKVTSLNDSILLLLTMYNTLQFKESEDSFKLQDRSNFEQIHLPLLIL